MPRSAATRPAGGDATRTRPPSWRRSSSADGVPAASIAWSYLLGAAREWLTPRPGRSLSTVAAALLAATCLLGFSAALVAETVPAKAAGTTQSPSGPIPPKVKPTPSSGGSPRQFTPCRPVLPRQATAATPAAGPPHLSLQGTAHARSC